MPEGRISHLSPCHRFRKNKPARIQSTGYSCRLNPGHGKGGAMPLQESLIKSGASRLRGKSFGSRHESRVKPAVAKIYHTVYHKEASGLVSPRVMIRPEVPGPPTRWIYNRFQHQTSRAKAFSAAASVSSISASL